MNYYLEYLAAIQHFPKEKIKFADEAHIVSKNLVNRKVLGVVNERSYLKDKTLHDKNASVTILTSLDPLLPVAVNYRTETNTQWDFVDFVYGCCLSGSLQPGDYLVVDNATIHASIDSYDTLKFILDYFHVKMVKLPNYSPELNPCELVFSLIKTHLRYHRGEESILNEVLKSFILVTNNMMVNFYAKCTQPDDILPEMNFE